jgi:hypothetical protein
VNPRTLKHWYDDGFIVKQSAADKIWKQVSTDDPRFKSLLPLNKLPMIDTHFRIRVEDYRQPRKPRKVARPQKST